MTNKSNKVLFIINKYSGGGYQPEVEGRIVDACQRRGLECVIEFTKARGHATELARDASLSNGFEMVVAVGGDGTVNETAAGLLHSETAMGIIPKGSGNGLARHLGIPMNFQDAIESLFQSEKLKMDSFTVNGKLSLNVSGIGFDGHVANLFASDKKRGLQGYIKYTVGEFFNFPEFEAEVENNGVTTRRKAFIIAIANSSQYGNNARIAPEASVSDGILHITFLHKVPIYRLDFVYALFAGTVTKTSHCATMETQNMIIRTPYPVAHHIDGEPCGLATTFDIRINPASLWMCSPTPSAKR